jgi:hypothetical protein
MWVGSAFYVLGLLAPLDQGAVREEAAGRPAGGQWSGASGEASSFFVQE